MVALLASALVLKNSLVCNVDHSFESPVYLFIDQQVIPGNIIVRQRGTLFHPGQHVRDLILDIDLYLTMIVRLRWDGTTQYTPSRLGLFGFTRRSGCEVLDDLLVSCWNVERSFPVTRLSAVAAAISALLTSMWISPQL